MGKGLFEDTFAFAIIAQQVEKLLSTPSNFQARASFCARPFILHVEFSILHVLPLEPCMRQHCDRSRCFPCMYWWPYIACPRAPPPQCVCTKAAYPYAPRWSASCCRFRDATHGHARNARDVAPVAEPHPRWRPHHPGPEAPPPTPTPQPVRKPHIGSLTDGGGTDAERRTSPAHVARRGGAAVFLRWSVRTGHGRRAPARVPRTGSGRSWYVLRALETDACWGVGRVVGRGFYIWLRLRWVHHKR